MVAEGRSRRVWLSWVMLGLAGGLVALRFVHLDLAPFVQDEPTFLLVAREQLTTGDWATHSTLLGSAGFLYGPAPLWFYGVTQAVVGSSAQTNITVVCIIVTACQVAFCVALVRALRRRPFRSESGRLLLAVVLSFLASSPYQFFWSRLAWDLSANFCAFAALALLTHRTVGPARSALLGVVLGFGFSSHPMIGPLVLVIGVGLLVEHVRQLRSALAVCGAFLVSFIAVNIPWLRYLLTVPVLAVTPAGTELSFSARLLELVRPASFRDFRYFLDDDYGAFARALPAPLRSTTLALAVTWILGAIVLFGLCVHARDSRPHVRRIALLGLATAVIYPIFFQWAGFGPHPHYMFPVGWVTVAGVALATDAGSRLRWARVWPVAITTSITALNLIVLFTLARFIIERGGTRGIHYGTPVVLQAEAVETLCARRGSPIYVENATRLFEAVFRQHASRVPQCLGRPVQLCKRPRCRDAPPSSVVARIEYAEPEGGRLRVSFADAEPADRR